MRKEIRSKIVSLASLGFLTFPFLLASCDIFDFGKKDSAPSSSGSSSDSSNDLASSSSLSSSSSDGTSGSKDISEESFAPISFHFIEENIQNSGDAIYIKAGENDILIDGGAKKGVSSTIKSYLDRYVTDGKLEYVFVTHAHEDHLGGLVGKNDPSDPSKKDGVLYSYKIDHIVDFSYFMKGSVAVDNAPSHELTDSEKQNVTGIYTDYLNARDYAISQGANAHTAKELTTEESHWKVELGEGLSVTLLYQFYYDHLRSETKLLDPSYVLSGFSDQNDCSLALLFEQGSKQMLFTGDAEEYAEASILRSNPELKEVSLFKAGHHGSPTASGEALLERIKPKAVVASCVAGNTEYNQKEKATTFPGQATIDRIAPYTDRFYVTTEGSFEDKSFHRPMNGDIVFRYDENGDETVTFSNSDLKLKDSAWFLENRTMPEAWKNDQDEAKTLLSAYYLSLKETIDA